MIKNIHLCKLDIHPPCIRDLLISDTVDTTTTRVSYKFGIITIIGVIIREICIIIIYKLSTAM